MEDNKRWLSTLKDLFSKPRMPTVAMALGLVGMVLIGLSSLPKDAGETPPPENDVSTYAAVLEERLETMVSSVRGAGASQVMVTLENGVEYVYANEEKINSDHTQSDSGDVSVRDDSQKTVVTVDADSGKQGLLVTEIQPTVRGVVVACEGANDETVAALVRTAVKTALNITDKRVCVIPYDSKGETTT